MTARPAGVIAMQQDQAKAINSHSQPEQTPYPWNTHRGTFLGPPDSHMMQRLRVKVHLYVCKYIFALLDLGVYAKPDHYILGACTPDELDIRWSAAEHTPAPWSTWLPPRQTVQNFLTRS
jgi:hypothetical protein